MLPKIPNLSAVVIICRWPCRFRVVLRRPGTHASSGASSGSSPAEPNSCLSDRGTLPTLDIVCGLKIQRLLGSARFGASLCPWGVLSWASGDFCAARRSALGLRFMVLLIHVLFVGAVFILSPVSPFPFYSLRVAACSRATVGMLLGGEDMHRFPVRSPRMDRDDLTLYHGTLFATYGLSVKSVLPTNYRSVKTFTDGPRTSLQAVSVKLLPTDRCFTDLSSVAKREVLPTLHHLVIIVLPTL